MGCKDSCSFTYPCPTNIIIHLESCFWLPGICKSNASTCQLVASNGGFTDDFCLMRAVKVNYNYKSCWLQNQNEENERVYDMLFITYLYNISSPLSPRQSLEMQH